MSTYFGYVEKEADSYVNWAEIGKNLVTTIEDIHRVREEKKDAIDEASRAYARKLQESPQGENRDANKWTLNFADDASQYMLMQDRLLKSGQMNMKQYMIARQNLTDGTDRAFTMMKKYQESYKTMMDRYRKGEASKADLDNFGFLEKFGDFNKSSLYINPNDGSISVGLVQEEKMVDGKKVRTMSKDPNDFANVSVLDGILNTKIDRFDSNKVATDLVGSIKPDVLTVYQGGLKITEKGVYNLKGQLIIGDPFKSVTSTAQALDNLSKEVLNTITITDEATKKDVGAFGNESKVAQEFQRVKALKDKGGQLNEKDNKLYESVKTALAEVSQASDEEKAMAINFEDSENAVIRAAMPTPYHEQSVLVDNMKFYGNPADNRQYDYTWDANEAARDPSKILKVVEGNTVTYKLSPEQKAAAEGYMRKQMRVRYAKEYTQEVTSAYTREEGLIPQNQTRSRATDADYNESANRGEVVATIEPIIELYNAKNSMDIEAAINHWQASDYVKFVERTDKGIKVHYIDSKKPAAELFFYSKNGQPFGNKEFTKQAITAFYPADKVPAIRKRLEQALAAYPDFLDPNISLFNDFPGTSDPQWYDKLVGVNPQFSGGMYYKGPGQGVLKPQGDGSKITLNADEIAKDKK
jgi:hypothetical protein